MKVELKINADTINAVVRLLEKIYELPSPTRQPDKLTRSITYDVIEVLLSKQKTIRKKQTLFDVQKKHKITLKYHEAFVLHIVINELIFNVTDDYTKMLLNKLSGEIHQKIV